MNNGEKQKVELALKELGEVMADTARTLAVLDFQLGPYWTEKGDIEHDVRRTHKRGRHGEVVFDPTGAANRVPLFAQLDELTKEWGPVKVDRATVKARLSGYERDYKRLVNELKYITRKADKNDKGPKGQKDFFTPS